MDRNVKYMSERDIGFLSGYLVALASLIHMDGTNTHSYEMWCEIGKPDAKTVRALGLSEYDREALNRMRRDYK